MARTCKPWYRASRGQWFATVKGQQLPLGITDPSNSADAYAALAALLERLKPTEKQGDLSPTLAELVPRFLDSKRPRVKPSTVNGYAKYLTFLLARFGTLRPRELSAAAVEDDCRQRRPDWSGNARRNYLATVELFMRWTGCPITLDKPPRESAGAETVISPESYNQALGAAHANLRPLLRFLWLTGCRPSEASGLTAEMVDLDSGTVRLREHKTAKRGKVRMIYLQPAAALVLREQIELHPSGWLFPNKTGGRFTLTGLTQAMWRISERIGVRVTAYGFRHSYATRALEKGLPDTHVAALLGHGSTRMIHAHYSHLDQNAKLLKEAALRVG